MTSAFASQLRQIAANSTHELDLRARRAAHAESLLFGNEVASKQDFDTIYSICIEGFQELCQLDQRFREYERSLFSLQAKDQDREQMNKNENEALDTVIDQCLGLLCGKALLRPGIQALEWLVRRFQVHIYNVRSLLLTILPYHELPIWRNVLSIVPRDKIVGEWKFVRPYLGSTWNVPRHAIVYAATNNDSFFAALNSYTLAVCRNKSECSALTNFWASVVVEATANRLDQARSGRREVQWQRTEDVLLKVIPVLNDGLKILHCDAVILSCYTIAMVIASKADLDDKVLDSLMVSICGTMKKITDTQTGILSLAVIVGRKTIKCLPSPVVERLRTVPDLQDALQKLPNLQVSQDLLDSLIAGLTVGLKNSNIENLLPFLERILRWQVQPGQYGLTANNIRPVLAQILKLNSTNGSDEVVRAGLIETLRKLSDEDTFSTIIAQSGGSDHYDLRTLEQLLGSTLQLLPASIPMNLDSEDQDLPQAADGVNIEQVLAKIPSRTASIISFLSNSQDQLYDQLCDAFELCSRTKASIKSFRGLALWSESNEQNVLLASFLLRFACESHGAPERSTALRLLSTLIEHAHIINIQDILPHVLILLADSAQSVRRAAAAVATALSNQKPGHSTEDIPPPLHPAQLSAQLKSLSEQHLYQVLERAIMPMLEECMLDSRQMGKIVRSTLSSGAPSDLKKSVRHSLFEILTIHALEAQSLRVKLGILQLLADVQKSGNEVKVKVLSPLLKTWSNLDEKSAVARAQKENLDTKTLDAAFVQLFDGRRTDLLAEITTADTSDSKTSKRPALIQAVFEHIGQTWKSIQEENQRTIAEQLFKLAFLDEPIVSRNASAVLQSVNLPSQTLATFVSISTSELTSLHNDPPPKKRRRTSQGGASRTVHVTDGNSSKLTFSLELIENSKPESRPELLATLFDALATLKSMKQVQRIDSPYLLNLCLSSILAIVGKTRVTGNTVDVSSVRAELVTECVRDCDNPQVLNTALLLAAALSTVVPDRMVHDIMPIFTLAGQSIFTQDDEHSVQVMNRAVDQIVPALVQSLRNNKQKHSLFSSMANLLTSFVIAFDHVPQHRRVAFYHRLFTQIGAEDFGFIIISMLSTRKSEDATFLLFENSVLDCFPPEVQLSTYSHLLDVVSDTLSPLPTLAEAILGVGRSTSANNKHSIARAVLRAARQITLSKTLRSQLSQAHQLEAEQSLQRKMRLENIFGKTLKMVHDQKDNTDVSLAAKECLESLLELMSATDLLQILPQILEELDDELRPQSLRILANRLASSSVKDSKTRIAATEFLGWLGQSLSSNVDSPMRLALLACMDRIVEIYGRKDPESVTVAAQSVINGVIPSVISLNTESDYKDATAALLTIATTVEVLHEGAVPVVLAVLPLVQEILESCVTVGGQRGLSLFNAASALLSAIFSSVAFIVDEEQITKLLKTLAGSSALFEKSHDPSTQNRDLLRVVARKVDLEIVLRSLKSSEGVEDLANAGKIEDAIYLLSSAVDKASKSTVVRHAELFSELFLFWLQARESNQHLTKTAQTHVAQPEDQIEAKLMDLSIKFIYKLNDTALRPIFESWVEWSQDTEDENVRDDVEMRKTLRQTSLFNVLIHFFHTLKAIVTSYATHVLKPISSIISQIASVSSEPTKSVSIDLNQQQLFKSALALLRATAVHDADGFYTAPSHFHPIGELLVKTLGLAAYRNLRPLVYSHIIPTIVSLAAATVDSPAHHHTLSHNITQLRRSGSPHVRLASIKTLHALIDRDEDTTLEDDYANTTVGDDWIQNTIGLGSGEGEGARGGGSVGEVMIYVNEMLEDDDDHVELEIRRWVQRVRERVGEDVFEV